MRTWMSSVILVALAIVALAIPSFAAAQEVAGATELDPVSALQEPGESVVLSNETTVSRWAHAADTFPIRTEPRRSARTITRLRYLTEDKLPEVYLVLDAKLDAAGDAWLHIRVPMRPNGRTGWVPADRMSQLYVVRTQLIIDRGARRATLYKSGRRIWQARVGVGKPGTPTPRGKFWVREKLKGDGKVYGPWAFGTAAYSNISDWPNGGVVGIHGTNQPGLIPGTPSHGCVRVRNDKIRQLARLMPIGTPVQIVR
jgi:lipoprotein-anchoring transpeptidase ErfK/SrfK